jgi:hypothetical protein
MKRIFVVVEGETEERFVRKVLYPYFILLGIYIDAQQWITNKKLGCSGGGGSYDLVQNHINKLVAKYSHVTDTYISTMIDLYGFPKDGDTVYDADIIKLKNGEEKVLAIQRKMEARIASRIFIPHVQLHEYEAILYSDLQKLSFFYTDKQKEIDELELETGGKKPEEINETPEGAPSKRIIKYISSYYKQKTTAGVITAEKIGLESIRKSCPHFNNWISRLESI